MPFVEPVYNNFQGLNSFSPHVKDWRTANELRRIEKRVITPKSKLTTKGWNPGFSLQLQILSPYYHSVQHKALDVPTENDTQTQSKKLKTTKLRRGEHTVFMREGGGAGRGTR